MRRAILAGLLSSLVLLPTAPAASAETVQCTGEFTGVTPGNLEVPANTHCRIFAARIGGNVSALPGSSFDMQRTEVGNNITGVANGANTFPDRVRITDGNIVGGNIQLKNGDTFEVTICGTTVGGKIDISDWETGHLFVGGERQDETT